MRRRAIQIATFLLIATACSQGGSAETESLSVVDGSQAPAAAVATPSSAAVPTDPSAPAIGVSPSTSIGAGEQVELATSGLEGDITWSAPIGTLTDSGSTATYVPPARVGSYEVVATNGTESAAATISVDTMTVFESDFSGEIEDEWIGSDVVSTESPSGERFLGEFGDQDAVLALTGLPTHDEVTVSFDLYILKSWDGLADDARWDLEIDSSRIIATTFSNGDTLQAWPGNRPYEENPGRSGAFDEDSLGYWSGTEDNLADASYHVERTVFHEGSRMWIRFVGHDLDGIAEESWGIDNVVVSISRTPTGQERPEALLDISVVDNRVEVVGSIADPATTDIVGPAIAEWFDDAESRIDVEVIDRAIAPAWEPEMRLLFHALRDVQDVRIQLGLASATIEGTVVTERYRRELVEDIENALGDSVWVTDNLTFAVDQSVVTEVEATDVRFETGSAELTPEAEAVLDSVADVLTEHPRMELWIAGNTDLTGSEGENDDLSRDRSRSVLDYFLALGFSGDRFSNFGAGADDPIEDEVSPDANDANRRVNFFVKNG